MRKQVAYLGPEGTYAEKAAHILSKHANYDSPIFVPCKGLHSVIKSIAYKNCDAAVVPIENSVEGGVSATLDALWKFSNIFISHAIVLPIKHALISSGEIKDISEVLSHPQALAQCSEWLLKSLPDAILLPTNSTSEAVNMVKGSSFRAAIGSKSLLRNQKQEFQSIDFLHVVPCICLLHYRAVGDTVMMSRSSGFYLGTSIGIAPGSVREPLFIHWLGLC